VKYSRRRFGDGAAAGLPPAAAVRPDALRSTRVERFFNLVVSGAVTGAIYSMMASGLVLTYQTSGIFNFGHGAVAFAVAYFYYQLNTGEGVHWIPALILSIGVFAPLLGLLLDRVLLRRLSAAPVYARIVGTIGLAVALPALVQWLAETVGDAVFDLGLPTARDVRSSGRAPGVGPFPPEVFRPFDIVIDSNKIAVFVAAALSALVLWFVLRRTRLGLAMRAVVDRRSLADLRGVNEARTSRAAWMLSMALAGLGGVLITPLFQLGDYLYTGIVLGSLFAVALSGLRSIPIAFMAGLLLGVVQNLIAGYSDDILPGFLAGLSGLRTSIPFLLTILVLVLYARSSDEREAGTVAEESPPPDHRAGLSPLRRRLPWAVFTVLLVAYALQWIDVEWLQADVYEAGLLARGVAIGLIFLSFVVVTGIGGMVSLAQGSFVVAGGFTAGWALNRNWGIDIPFVASNGQLNFALAALLGAAVAAVLGAIIALPVRRLGALALALATLALAFCLHLTAFDYEPIGKETFGWLIRAPTLDVPGLNELADLLLKGPQDRLDFSQTQQQVLLVLVLFGLVTLIVHALQRSATGRAMLAVRSSEVAAATSGISPARQKVVLFALSAGIAGFGGAVYGMINFTITRGTAPPLLSLVWLTVAVTFGIRRPGGALLAGLAFACSQQIFTWVGQDFLPASVEEVTTSPYFTPILFGLGAINLAKNPDGLLALVGHQRLERKLRRERAAHLRSVEAELQGQAQEQQPSAAPGVSIDGAMLALDDVAAGYGDAEVLHGVTLVVRPAEVAALLGANGAGKSTLCLVAAGALTPTRGRVLVEGHDLTAEPAHVRARGGLLLVPEARGIFPGLTVEENLRVSLESAEARERAYERFPILGTRRAQRAGSLSGGEQQMLSLAPALASPPKVFVADEPTLGLAPLAAEVVIEAIREIRDLGSSVLLVEEKAREVMELADTITLMELGRIVWSGPRAETDIDRLAASYLGTTASS
jgi:branched-subunit amino acid ABC-type transport system permease component/ABC-type branched-subunit amino acid transport system ATPase component